MMPFLPKIDQRLSREAKTTREVQRFFFFFFFILSGNTLLMHYHVIPRPTFLTSNLFSFLFQTLIRSQSMRAAVPVLGLSTFRRNITDTTVTFLMKKKKKRKKKRGYCSTRVTVLRLVVVDEEVHTVNSQFFVRYPFSYSLVQWNWFSDVTGCMQLRCIQWPQRIYTGSPPLLSDLYCVYVCWMEHDGPNFTAQGCTFDLKLVRTN